jgi:hypothetical protein
MAEAGRRPGTDLPVGKAAKELLATLDRNE